MALPQKIRVSYDDYLILPDDGKRYQIVDGEVYVSPAPSVSHQRIVGAIYRILYALVSERDLGEVFISPVDVVLSYHDVVQPDILFVSKGREAIVQEQGIFGSPDLAVEVLSPRLKRLDRVVKKARYARFGVANLWLVAPITRVIEEHQLAGDTYLLRSRVAGEDVFKPALFPDLQIHLVDIWPPAR